LLAVTYHLLEVGGKTISKIGNRQDLQDCISACESCAKGRGRLTEAGTMVVVGKESQAVVVMGLKVKDYDFTLWLGRE
jgi:hypothetical protein